LTDFVCSEYINHYISFIRQFKKGGRVYLAEVENRRVGKKVVQHFIRYVGKQADGRTILSTSMSDAQVDQVKLYGPLLVLHHLAEEIGLRHHLGPYANEILSLVYAHCLDYRSVNHMEGWFKRTDLNLMLDLNQLTESRLLNGMDFLEQADPDRLQKDIFASVQARYPLDPGGVIYDVTNTYLYGKHCDLGKAGHDKEGVRGRPLIQIGLGVTLKEGIPVFHKTFDGNIGDARTLQDLITTFSRYDLKSGTIIYDRGITSGRNIADIKALRWETICGLALTEAVQKFWRPVTRKKRDLPLADRIQLNQTTFYVTSRPYALNRVRGTLYLCFNPRQQVDLRDTRREEVDQARQLLKAGKAIKPGLERFLDRRGKLLTEVLTSTEEFDGYSCIFSTRALPKAEVVRLYFDKDLVEKAFRSLKGVVKLRPIRHWLTKRVVAHVFLCYLAYLLLALLKFRLKPIGMEAAVALDELDTLYKVYLRDSKNVFQIARVVALSKKQETILKTIDPKLLKLDH
jgi:transposase